MAREISKDSAVRIGQHIWPFKSLHGFGGIPGHTERVLAHRLKTGRKGPVASRRRMNGLAAITAALSGAARIVTNRGSRHRLVLPENGIDFQGCRNVGVATVWHAPHSPLRDGPPGPTAR